MFLVLANCQGQLTAVLVEKGTSGLIITPMSNFLGLRSNMLAEIFLIIAEFLKQICWVVSVSALTVLFKLL